MAQDAQPPAMRSLFALVAGEPVGFEAAFAVAQTAFQEGRADAPRLLAAAEALAPGGHAWEPHLAFFLGHTADSADERVGYFARAAATATTPDVVHAAHANAVREYLQLYSAGVREAGANWERMRDHARAAVAAGCVRAYCVPAPERAQDRAKDTNE